MKQSLKKIAAATFALSIVCTSGPVLDVLPASASTASHQILSELTELNDDTAPGIKMNENGFARSIDGQLSDTQVENDEDAKEVLRNIAELLGIKNINQELKFQNTSESLYNTVYSFKQYYKDIELTNSYVTVTVDNATGKSEFLNSSFIPDFSMDVNPDVSASNAAQIVMEKYSVTLSEAPRLVIYSMDNTVHHLAWEVKTDSFSPSMVYLDAKNGEILYAEMPSSANDEGDLAATYSLEEKSPLSGPFTVDIARDKDEENLYKLHDTERNIYVIDSSKFYYNRVDKTINPQNPCKLQYNDKSIVITNENNQWDGYETELAVLYNVQKAYDFYAKFMWTGTNDKKSDLFIIPKLIEIDKNGDEVGLDNAFALNGRNTLAFGTGDGINTRNWGLSYDIVVHEYTHRVTGQKIGWNEGTHGESNSLDEAYSDIMAEYADGTDEWQIGTYHYLNGTSFVRDLSDPTASSDPNSKKVQYYKYSTPAFFMNVEEHEGSTVISHAAYLMHKLGISDSAAEKIWFYSLDYMPHGLSATFSDCRTAVLKAADKVLINYPYSTRLEWAYSIRKAFNAVNIRDENDLVGDVNLDFKIDEDDVTALRDYLDPDKTFQFTQPVQEHYCDLTSDGEITSEDLTFLEKKVAHTITIINQPKDVTKERDWSVSLSVEAQVNDGSDPNTLQYQWYIKEANSKKFVPALFGDSSAYTFNAFISTDGRQMYCEITDEYFNRVVTDTITIHVRNLISITNNLPDNIAVRNYGNTATLFIGATGDDIQYAWYEQYPGASEAVLTTTQSNMHQVTLTKEKEGMKVWCEITDKFNYSTSSKKTTIVAATSGDTNSDGRLNADDLYFLHNLLTGKVQVDDTVNIAACDLNQNGELDAKDLSKLLENELIDKSKAAGDVNADGRINEDDLVALQDHLLGRTSLETALQGYAADLCNDGAIDVFDMIVLRKKVVSVLTQPSNASAPIGSDIKTSVQVTGDEVSYQWYCREPGQQDFEKTEMTEDTFQTIMTEELHGSEVYCEITDKHGNVITSDTVMLGTLAIANQPLSTLAAIGESVETSVEASGTIKSYQWWVKNPDTENFEKSAVTGPTYECVMTEETDGCQVYCIITDEYGNTVQSDTATLGTIILKEQPETVYAHLNGTAKASVTALGDNLTYQWWIKNKGQSEFTRSAITEAEYTCTMTENTEGREIYCIVTDSKSGVSVQSNIITIRTALQITKDLKDVAVEMGQSAEISVSATGNISTYEWYCKPQTALAFEKNTEFTSNSYTLSEMNEETNGCEVFCMITDAYGNKIKTQTVTLSAAVPQNSTLSISGDVNNDGILDISDAIFLARFVAEDSTLDMSNFNVQNADINGDGLTSAADTVYIIRKIAKLI